MVLVLLLTSLITLRSLADTACLAEVLARRLPSGALLVLVGDLGAGKTTLVQQLAQSFNSPASVSSPTYTLIHEYPSPQGLLVHIDAYRLTTGDVAANLEHLGLDDYLDRAHCVVVEWGEALLEPYPEAFVVYLELTDDPQADARHVTITQHNQPRSDLETAVSACIEQRSSADAAQKPSTEVR